MHKKIENPSKLPILTDVSRNVADARKRRGLTLAGLSELSAVSKATISQIENGNQNPTLETIWRLANALDIGFGALIGGSGESVVTEGEFADPSDDGISARFVEAGHDSRNVEVFMMTIPAGARRVADPHVAGVCEHVLVLSGELKTGPIADPILVGTGQSAQFNADVPHLYQAESTHCTAIVSVVYPREDIHITPFDIDLAWPKQDDQDDWAMVRAMLVRAHIEVQNGCKLLRLTFRSCPFSASRARKQILKEVPLAHTAGGIVYAVVSAHHVPAIAVLYRGAKLTPVYQGQTLHGDLVGTCRKLVGIASLPHSVNEATLSEVEELATKPVPVIVSALAAEALTQWGRLCAPAAISGKIEAQVATLSDHGDRVFEDRIDVDAYEAYELAHPGYARQVFALAEILPDISCDETCRMLDIGTGPGLPLQMLLELKPELTVLGLDPSHKAFSHFMTRFRNDQRVAGMKLSITDYRPQNFTHPGAISIGASHHLNTADFFKNVHACLLEGAPFIVCDEMISQFSSPDERARNLIMHHLWYILDSLATVPDHAAEEEVVLGRLLSGQLPQAMILAAAGKIPEAQRLVRDTYRAATDLRLPAMISTPLAAFPRFHLLELQALVAGLDYEVEQKTYPARFLNLAQHHGFRFISHQRIYATDGDNEFDAGTHLFYFERS